MLSNCTIRYLRRVDQRPCPDQPSSVEIRLRPLVTPDAAEKRMALPVPFAHRPALQARAAAVRRIHQNHPYTRQPSLVVDKPAQLGERSAIENRSLFRSSPDPAANAFEEKAKYRSRKDPKIAHKGEKRIPLPAADSSLLRLSLL